MILKRKIVKGTHLYAAINKNEENFLNYNIIERDTIYLLESKSMIHRASFNSVRFLSIIIRRFSPK